MKVAIVTLHRVFNYGSILQTYATQKILEKKGYDVEIIDYITEERSFKKQFLSTPPGLKKDFLHRSGYYLFKLFSMALKRLTLWKFLEKNVNLSKIKYKNIYDLRKIPPKADIYITGSDQVWNSKYNNGIDYGFYLDFTNNKNKFSFSSSFGMDKVPKSEIKETKQLLSNYKLISVREKEGQNVLKGLGITRSEVIIDPTLQITKEEWIQVASKRLVKGKYVLLMLLYNEDNNATKYAREIADRLGVKLVKISWEMKKPKDIDKLFTHRSPEDFLSLFNYAECIVTNSFHGLAFSLNLEKEFIIVRRNEFNSRIENLLKICKLEKRLVDKNNFDISLLDKKIDYKKVNTVLDKELDKANKFLDMVGDMYEEN